MPKCKVDECSNQTRSQNTSVPYCVMHLTRLKRNGCLNKKANAHRPEKIPYFLNDLISNNADKTDAEVLELLVKAGVGNISEWNVKYRRRKLGIKKYGTGEERRNKEWIRRRAITSHGGSCELCGYNLTVDCHHIVSKKDGGTDEVSNLLVVCQNCHALFTRNVISMNGRDDLEATKMRVLPMLLSGYGQLFKRHTNDVV